MNKKNRNIIETFLNSPKLPFPIMVLVTVLMYYKVLFGYIWLKWDMYGAILPSYISVSAHIKEGALPLWEPFVHRGIPLSHLLGVPVWFPTTILISILGQTQYLLQLQFFLIILFAAISMYLACTIYSKNRWLCALGGCAYSSCGLFVSNAEHITFIIAASLFPLLHYSIKKTISTESKFYTFLFGSSIALLILNSYPPFIIFSLFYVFIEVLLSLRRMKNRRVFFKNMGIAAVVVISCSLVTIVTTMQVMNQITRSRVPWEIATAYSLNIWNWFSSLSPAIAQMGKNLNPTIDISMNNTYIALPILIAMLMIRALDREQKILYGFLVFSILLCMGQYAPVYQLFYNIIPGIDTFKFPAGLRYFYFYFVVIIAIRNIQFILDQNESELYQKYSILIKKFALVFSVILISLSVILISSSEPTDWMIKYFVEEIAITLVILLSYSLIIKKCNKRAFLASFITLIVFFSYIGVFRNAEFTIGVKERPYSYEEEIGYLYNNSNDTIINSFSENMNLMESDTIISRNFNNGGYIGSFDLSKFDNARNNGLLPLTGDPAVWVSNIDENNNTLPKQLPSSIQWKGNKFDIIVESLSEKKLVLEQTYFPGWEAKVNGKSVEIEEWISSGVMSVPINIGMNQVEFEFKPIEVIVSAYITFLSWLTIIIYFMISLFRKYKKTPVR